MNIFVLDTNPKQAAKYHCDKHVIKMIVESAQMLCTAHHECGTRIPPYRKTHVNHPCSKWVRQSQQNYNWLCDMALALCEEYTLRYGKRHKTQDVIEWCINNKPFLMELGITPYALAMPDDYKHSDPVLAYRTFYKVEKRNFATWKTNTPDWWN